jgi:ligand-binding sensor domain-containing protein
MRSGSLCILFLGCIAFCCRAQLIDEKKFHHFTTREGLSNNFITGIAQDSTGYIWISTIHGLNRFDGVTFTYFLQNSKHNPIPENNIYSMQLFPGNELAIATDDGAQIINTRTLETKNLNIPTPDAFRYWSNYCEYVYKDDDNNYGVSTKTGFYIFSATGRLKNRYDHFTEKDIGHSWIMFGNHVFKLPDGNLLQENSLGAFLFDRKKNLITDARSSWPQLSLIYKPNPQRPRFFFISKNILLLIDPDKDNFVMLDIRNGSTRSFPSCFNMKEEINWQSKLNRVNDSLWSLTCSSKGFYLIKIDTASSTVACNATKYFGDQFCKIVFCDDNKRMWVGTNDGFFMQEIAPAVITSFACESSEIQKDFSITSLLIHDNKIFAGTDKKEIIIINKKNDSVEHIVRFKTILPNRNTIHSMILVSPDTLWAASTSELLWLNTKNLTNGRLFLDSLFNSSVDFDCLFGDKKGNVWIGSNQINSVIFFDLTKRRIDSIHHSKDPSFRINMANSFSEDRHGNIWIGGDAIARWNPHLKKVDTLIERLSTQKNRKRGYVIMNDSKGDIWTTVNDDGVARITGDNIIHLRPENFLANSQQQFPSLFGDRIFLAAFNSIGILNLHDLKSTILDHDDGLPAFQISSSHFSYDSSDGAVWFACKNYICKIASTEDPGSHVSPPILKVADVSVLNDTVINYPSSAISLKHSQNDIKISLSAINYTDPSDMRFAYRLKDRNDTGWIETGTQPMILLTNLPPGDYEPEIKVYSHNNKWAAQETKLKIRIAPPFWQAWWFILLLGLIIVVIAYTLHKRRLNLVREKANIDKQLMELEMKALHAQMNPHFIFNCLNSIKEMILHDEKQNASRYLSKFAQLIRITLEESRRPLITVAQCIDHLLQYLEMEKIRFAEFNYTIETEPGLPVNEIHIAPMLVQPLVENAIWHGLQKQTGEKNLSIRFYKKEDQIICEIEDNGIGIRQSKENKAGLHSVHRSLGIENINERLEVLNEKFKINCSLTINDRSDLPGKQRGTLAVLRLNR